MLAADEYRIPVTVVLGEDESLIAESLVHELERNGLTVLAHARTADDVVHAVEAYEPDLVLLDIHLANESSGIEAASRLADRDGRRCLFISGMLDLPTRSRLQALDPLAVLSKPVLTSQILDVIAASVRPHPVVPSCRVM